MWWIAIPLVVGAAVAWADLTARQKRDRCADVRSARDVSFNQHEMELSFDQAKEAAEAYLANEDGFAARESPLQDESVLAGLAPGVASLFRRYAEIQSEGSGLILAREDLDLRPQSGAFREIGTHRDFAALAVRTDEETVYYLNEKAPGSFEVTDTWPSVFQCLLYFRELNSR